MAAVEVKGVVELRRALRKFEPTLSKEMQFEFKRALAPIAREAKGFIPSRSPMSGWRARSFSEGKFPTFNAGLAKSSIGYKTTPSKPNRKGFVSLAKIYNKSAAGAIYETAGRKNPNGVSPSGKQFIKNLGSLYGQGKDEGRAIYRAYENDRGAAKDAVMKAIHTAERQFNAISRKAA